MTEQQRSAFLRLSTTNIADALDFFHLSGATYGVSPTFPGCKKIVGNAVTLRLIPAGPTPPKAHLGYLAVSSAAEGDIIVVDNGGRKDVSCWGGVLSTSASIKGISGVVIDGACRDIDDYVDLNFSVYAKGAVTASARGRVVEEATNIPVQFCGVLVNPGDLVMADRSGVVFVPAARINEVLTKATELYNKEEAMCADLRNGMSSTDVDKKYNYNKMLIQN